MWPVMVTAALATWLLTFADSYPTFLLAALGVGIAGGSFSVGITYVSKWFPKEKQGTALGIFGAGNVGRGRHQVPRPHGDGALRLDHGGEPLGRWAFS